MWATVNHTFVPSRPEEINVTQGQQVRRGCVKSITLDNSASPLSERTLNYMHKYTRACMLHTYTHAYMRTVRTSTRSHAVTHNHTIARTSGRRELREVFLPVFAKAVAAGAQGIMSSYQENDGVRGPTHCLR